MLVLGIVEEKSNPNDIGASFTHFQVHTSPTKGIVCVSMFSSVSVYLPVDVSHVPVLTFGGGRCSW